MGAVWASFIIKPVQAIFLYTESRKIFTFHFNTWKIIYLPVIFISMGIVCELIATNSTRVLLQAVWFLVTAIMVFLVYRNEIIPLAKQWHRP